MMSQKHDVTCSAKDRTKDGVSCVAGSLKPRARIKGFPPKSMDSDTNLPAADNSTESDPDSCCTLYTYSELKGKCST